MADTRPVPQPLSPGDRRLRAGRYEVLHHGPKGSGKGSDPSSLADTARFATERDARAFASSLTRVPGDLVVIDRVAPRSSRCAGCPWDRREVAVVPEPRTCSFVDPVAGSPRALDLLTNRSDSTQVPSPARFYGVDHVGKVWQHAVVIVPMGEWGDMAAIAAGIPPAITEADWSWQEEVSGWNGHRVRQGDGRDGYRVTLGRYADPDQVEPPGPTLQQMVDAWSTRKVVAP